MTIAHFGPVVQNRVNFKRMGFMTMFVCLTFILLSSCRGHRDHNIIKAKIGHYAKTAPWKPLGWKANMSGSMLLSVLQKYRVPLKATLTGNGTFTGCQHNAMSRSCSQIKANNKAASDGVYNICLPGTNGTRVYCDMTTDGGAWTVFQRRFNGKTNFNRDWTFYKEGFGDPEGEYWLGNELVHKLTTKGNCTLRVDMVTTKRHSGFAVYQNFSLGSEEEGYILRIGKYSGTAGQYGGTGLSYANGMKFSTKDRDNDLNGGNCASEYRAGFWYRSCFNVNLNAPYTGKKFFWNRWEGTKSIAYLKESKMMLKC